MISGSTKHERGGESAGRSDDLRINHMKFHRCANSVKLRRRANGVDDDED